MNGLVDRVKQNIPQSCRSRQCRGNGCSVSLKGLDGQRVLINMDCKDLNISNQRRCDYVFVGKVGADDWIVPIELKRGDVKANEVRDQLQSGTEFAERLVAKIIDIRFQPVAAHGGKVHKIQTEALKKREGKVRFQNKEYEIKLIRCGSALSNVLS